MDKYHFCLWCLWLCRNVFSADVTTLLPPFQVTSPSDITLQATSNRNKGNQLLESRNATPGVGIGNFPRSGNRQSEEGYSKVAYAGSIRGATYIGAAHVRKEPEGIRDDLRESQSENMNELASDQQEDVLHGPKKPFPPVPGVGYVPPSAALIEQTAAAFQNDRDVPRVEYVTADCFSNYMKIVVQFNGSFSGLVYSSGYAHDSECVYVNGSGTERYEFSIRLNRCGTLGRPEFELTANEVPDRNHFMWNTITVQYNPEIEEDWDEHFQVTCEYGYEFRRTVTFPVLGVEKNTASPYLVQLSPPQCYMEVRSGFGPTGKRLTGAVTVGDPLTLMIHMESDSTEFDVAVSSCYAHNGAKKKLQLIDANGCILKDQLMSPFRGVRNVNGAQHVMLYAYFKAFRFTSSPALYLECDVHMCHGTCPAQKCHWKSLTKRSVEAISNLKEQPVSQNISLFQALQVLQETPDDNGTGRQKKDDHHSGSVLCLPITGLTALSTLFAAAFLLATLTCIFLCIRLRRMKEKLALPATATPFYENHKPNKRL